MSSAYQLLGVKPTATREEIRDVYTQKGIALHDRDTGKCNDPAAYLELTKAWQFICDDSRRKLYDKALEEGMERGGGACNVRGIARAALVDYMEGS